MLKVTLATSSFNFARVVKGRNLAVHLLRLWAQRDPALAGEIAFETIEHTGGPPERFLDQLLASSPDLLGLSCYLWNTPFLISCAAALREALPGTRVVIGGPDASPRAEQLLRRHGFLDAVALGEGEEALRLLLRRLVASTPRIPAPRPGSWCAETTGASAPTSRCRPWSSIASPRCSTRRRSYASTAR